MLPLRLVAATLAAFAALVAPAFAGDPIMPLEQVERGMRCTALTVIQGTEPSPFDAEVLDVVRGDPALDGPRILVAVSGAAVERTGIGAAFSGSPVYCRDAAGVARVVGAISESIGEYGGKVALVTPIEAILAVRTRAPGPPGTATRVGAARRLGGPIRRLTAPLTISGLSTPLARAFTAAARRAGRPMVAAPDGSPPDYPVQMLRPGSAMAAGLSSGDLSVGALGTVAYVDGSRVWGFGHAFEAAGARALLLQDAYIFRVINDPVPSETGGTYKLGVGGHNVGTVSNDELSAVAGTLGRLPATIPVRVSATDADTRARRRSTVQVADDVLASDPLGSSLVTLIAPIAVTQTASNVLRAAPGRLSGRMCVRIVVREIREPLRICNRYVSMLASPGLSGPSNVVAERAGTDIARALETIDAYQFDPLHVRGVTATLTLRRGIRQAYLRSVKAPRRVRPGQRIRLRVVIERVLGPRRTLRLRARVPRAASPGRQRLVLTGTPVDRGGDLFEEIFGDFEIEGEGAAPDDPGPPTIAAVVKRIRRLERYDGVRMSFQSPGRGGADSFEDALGLGGRAARAPKLYRDPELRISGRVSTRVRVTAPR